jgi:hypothetical protein
MINKRLGAGRAIIKVIGGIETATGNPRRSLSAFDR